MGFKPLIGREYDDPMIQQNISDMFSEVLKQDDGSIGFRVSALTRYLLAANIPMFKHRSAVFYSVH